MSSVLVVILSTALIVIQCLLRKRQSLLKSASSFFIIKRCTKHFSTKQGSYFIEKYIDLVIKYSRYYRTRRFYDKMRQLLENAPLYYKTGHFTDAILLFLDFYEEAFYMG